eukprot:3186089-Amphidinium_carterae.2
MTTKSLRPPPPLPSHLIHSLGCRIWGGNLCCRLGLTPSTSSFAIAVTTSTSTSFSSTQPFPLPRPTVPPMMILAFQQLHIELYLAAITLYCYSDDLHSQF